MPRVSRIGEALAAARLQYPANPRYCFVSINGPMDAVTDEYDDFMPLTGEIYIRAYHPPPQGDYEWGTEREVATAIASIKKYGIVPYETLKICWPHEFTGNIPLGCDDELDAQKQLPGVPPLSFGSHESPTLRMGALIQQLFLVSKDGILNLDDISITIMELTRVVHIIPDLGQSALYLSLPAWSNPEGGLMKVSDLATLQECFPQLLLIWYETTAKCRDKLFHPRAFHAPLFRVFARSRPDYLRQSEIACMGQPCFPPGPAVLHAIRGLVKAFENCRVSVARAGIMGSILASVDYSGVPVLMPAAIVGQTPPPTGWTLMMDLPPVQLSMTTEPRPPSHDMLLSIVRPMQGNSMLWDSKVLFHPEVSA
ncbi:uncharacterized protein EI90DRAFT_3285271 [Cantharellus anzutake]|uniref:uncharacterized protein n=1 Tax=Cantharellus anzutake TaxID=1750568 RepID=UPI001903FB5E|nr:uncharacterized protein EI90DRAFT_3285271 [Cantharellus anzutake]KAF8342158.1 hypothetical protein EI90DRAFT_3285271 [Cantharellus anzutake]